MRRVGIYDQIKSAIQDLVAPVLHEITGQLHGMRADIQRLDQKIDYMKGELLAEIRLVDTRIDGLDKRIDGIDKRIDGIDKRIEAFQIEVRTAIDVRERLAALEARRA